MASNGGKAVGWIHVASTPSRDSATSSSSAPATSMPAPVGHVVLQVAKIPLTAMVPQEPPTEEDSDEGPPHWVSSILQLCQKGLDQLAKQEGSSLCYKFSSKDGDALQAALRGLDGEATRVSPTVSEIPEPHPEPTRP